MTVITTWGPYTWYFLHIMAEKVKDEHFEKCKNDIIDIIVSLFRHLPCDYCAEHANKIIPSINATNMKNKEALKSFLFKFHNDVSTRTNTTAVETINILEKYKQGNIKKSAELLYKVFHTYDKTHMMNEFSRNQMLIGLRPKVQKIIDHC
jgi:formate dehydrogenase maturation protein FdhE